jgi:hypothetical protein
MICAADVPLQSSTDGLGNTRIVTGIKPAAPNTEMSEKLSLPVRNGKYTYSKQFLATGGTVTKRMDAVT